MLCKGVDRVAAMALFVSVVDRGGFSAAARQARRSPASVSRAVAQLEYELGQPLLMRTTRRVSVTRLGEAYLAACRRILDDIDGMQQLATRESLVARGVLSVTAPVAFGRLHVRPIVDAFLARTPGVRARLVLVDRVVDVIDEGVDVAVRIGELADSSLVAVRAGDVTRVTCASPRYLATHPAVRQPADLARHAIIALSQVTPTDTWRFGARKVTVVPRLVVNTADAAIDSALAGHGITCVLSYQVAAELRRGRLVRVLADRDAPVLPVHLVYPAGSALVARVRAFVDFATPRLRKAMSPAGPRGAVGA